MRHGTLENTNHIHDILEGKKGHLREKARNVDKAKRVPSK
jgi:hypothetical protein